MSYRPGIFYASYFTVGYNKLILIFRNKKKKDRPLSDDEMRDKVPDEISTEKVEEEKRLQLRYWLL